MSGKATGWALEQQLPPTTKLVLVALADECRRDGTTCFPARKGLAECVGIKPRALSRHLAGLEDRGLIHREERFRDNGSRTSTLYHLALDGPLAPEDNGGIARQAKATLHEPEQGTPCTPGQGHVVEPTQNEPGSEPNPVTPIHRLPKVAGKRITVAEWHRAGEILGAFNGAAQTSYTLHAHFTPIIGRIREHPELTADQHSQIIARAFASPWWGDHPGPEVIYGKASLFERAIEGWRRRGTAPEKRQRVVA